VLAPPSLNITHAIDRGMVPTALDEQLPLHLAGGRGFRGRGQVCERVAVAAAGHVLEDEQPQPVSPVVIAIRLDLEVLADGDQPSCLAASMSNLNASSVGARVNTSGQYLGPTRREA